MRTAERRPAPRSQPLPRASLPALPLIAQVLASPDRRHRVELTPGGGLRVNGRWLCASQALGAPVWRRDSRALAFLHQTAAGLRLVVLPELDAERPLVWQLPAVVVPRSQVFWISPQRVGVGAQSLMPQVMVSWTTTVAAAHSSY